MRRLSVLLFVICWAWGAWHFGEEIALTRISQVTDLAVNNNGEIYSETDTIAVTENYRA